MRAKIIGRVGLIAWLVVLVIPVISKGHFYPEVAQKRLELVMRQIGHEVLLSMEDCTSRVLPIQSNGNQFTISFEREFAFDPDDIISIVQREMTQQKIASNYFIEVIQCASKDVVHSYEVGNPGFNACKGRVLPPDCYDVVITLLDNSDTDGAIASKAQDGKPTDPFAQTGNTELLKSPFLVVSSLLLLGLLFYQVRRKKNPLTDPDLITIGASQFDKKNMELSIDNKKVELSNKEAALLTLLHSAANTPVNRELILNRVWGDQGHYIGRTLDVFISKLRKKLEADESVKIVNIRGVGYKLVMD